MYIGQPRVQFRQEGRFLTNNRIAMPLATLRTWLAHEAAQSKVKSKASKENGPHRIKAMEKKMSSPKRP